MQRWTNELLRHVDPLTFAMNILAERGKKLNKEAPLAKKLDEAKEVLRTIRDICQSNKQYLDGVISVKEAIYRKVQNDYYVDDLENHLNNDCNEASGYIRIRGLTPDDVMADKEMVNCIIGRLEKLESSDGNYWDTLDEAVESGINQIISDRHPIPTPCANCGSSSDTIKADGHPILVGGKPCCVKCIKLYGRCCEACDQETLEGTTRIRGANRAAGASLMSDVCKECSKDYRKCNNCDDYVHNAEFMILGGDDYCDSCAKHRLLVDTYELYKKDWMGQRGYNECDRDQENGFRGTGEDYACCEEFCGAEFRDAGYMKHLLDEALFYDWVYIMRPENKCHMNNTDGWAYGHDCCQECHTCLDDRATDATASVNEGIPMDFAIGDEVVTTEADSEYQYLVGTITSITTPGTAAHQTDNETPDIYVDFSGDYPVQLMADVESVFAKIKL